MVSENAHILLDSELIPKPGKRSELFRGCLSESFGSFPPGQYSLQNSLPPPVFAMHAALPALPALPAAAPPTAPAVLPPTVLSAPAFVPPAAAVRQPAAPAPPTGMPDQAKLAAADDALLQLIGKLEKLTVAAVQAANPPQPNAGRAPRGNYRNNRQGGFNNNNFNQNSGGNFSQENGGDFQQHPGGNYPYNNSGNYHENFGRSFNQPPPQQYQQSGHVQNGVYMRGGQGGHQQWQVSNLPQQRYQQRATNPSYRARGNERELAFQTATAALRAAAA